MKTFTILAVTIAALTIPIYVAVSNYSECRAAGFSTLYCITTHLVR